MSEPSLAARIFDFCWAVLSYWTVWVTGFVLVSEQATEFFFPKLFGRIDERFPKEKRRAFLLWVCAFGFVWASFEAFDDVNQRLRQAQQIGPVAHERHLTDDRQGRMLPLLKLDSGENYYFEINSIPSCDECEDYAEEMRIFISSIPGWKADGGPTPFWDSVNRNEGLLIFTRKEDKDLSSVKKLENAFDSAGIPLTPAYRDIGKGTIVIVVTKAKK
jgi:hypothetical protein